MNDDRRNVWDLFTLGLWSIFFAVGLVPELAFYTFRDLAGVVSYTALVNSSAVITVSFSVYLALFAARQCRAAGLGRAVSQGKALEVAVLGLLAFLEIPAKGSVFEVRTLLEIVLDFRSLPGRYLQNVVLFVGLSKFLAWLYLYSLLLRFHAFGNRLVFASIPSLLPSMRAVKDRPRPVEEREFTTPSDHDITLGRNEIEDQASETKQG